MKAWVKFTVTSIFVALLAIGVALLSRMMNRVLNSCGTGRFEDDACVCVEPYTGAHCEIINCGYGSIVTSVWLVDTITTKDNEDSVTGCACDNQFWGVNCEQCSSYNKDECTGACDVNFYGPRCEVLCMADATGKHEAIEDHEDAKGEANWFVTGQGLCKQDGQVACKRDVDDLYFTGDHCELKCPNCINGGICRYDEGGAFCECPAGFAGALCESECPLRCSGLNGVCNIVDGEAICDCNLGRTGSGCELTCCVRGARTSRGIKNGDCPATGGCDCDAGFFGPECDCSAATCNNNGACNNVTGACECDERFSGLKCEYCSDQYVGPLCTIVRQNCTFHGEFTIINKHGDYGCLCDPGFAGEQCDQCMENAYPKPTGSNDPFMCTNIVPDSMCHNGRVDSEYDAIRRPDMTMCKCEGHFSAETDCATCMENWYGPECDVYCAEPCVTSGGVCLQSGPGCTCAGSLSVDVETQTCVLCAAGECQNGGICYNGVCQCDPGFFGDLCEVSAPMHEGKVCNGEYGSSVLTTFDAPCQSKDDCLDTSHPNILNKKMALQVERYKWEDSMICYRTDTPQALRTVSGCCVDSDADGRCDKANLTIPRSQCEDVPLMGEFVRDICDNRVLEGEVNVFEWCLSKQRGCTKNGECADPILCGDYVPGVESSEWEKRWVSDHTSGMSSLMSEVWRFPVDGIEDPFAFREHYNDTDLDEVCTQPEVYTQCRDLLIPDVDTFTFNPKQKRLFRDGWQPMPEFGNGCGVVWSKVYNLGNATNFTVPIGPVHVDRIHVEGIAAVYAVDASGDLVPGNPGKVISGLEVLGKGDVKIVLYDYKDDECERLQIRAASMFEVCETLTIVELDYDWGPFCKWWVTYNHTGGFEERKYQQSLVCAGCEDYQEGCEGLPLEDQPMPDPCDVGLSAWLDFCDVYMSDNKVDGTCGRISCECEEGPLGIGGDACQYNCPIPLGFTTPCGEGEDPPLGRCVGTVTTALNLGTSQGVCECFNPVANPLEGCIVNCDEDSFTCSKDVDTPFTFRSQGCNYEHVQSVTILPGAVASTTQGLKNFTGVSYGECNTTFESFGEACFTDGVDVFLGNHVAEDMECNVLLPDSVCNALYGRCECATPYSVLSPEGMVYFNPEGNYRAALMQGYDITQYVPFMTYAPPIRSPMTLERANTYCPKDNEFRFPSATCMECMGAQVCMDTSTNTDIFGDTCESYADGENCGDFDRYDVNPFRLVSSGTCESNGFQSLNLAQCGAYDTGLSTNIGTVTNGCVKNGDDVTHYTFRDLLVSSVETLPVCKSGVDATMYEPVETACAGTLSLMSIYADLSGDDLLNKCYYDCNIYGGVSNMLDERSHGFGVIEEGPENKCFCISSFPEGCTPAQESLFGGLIAFKMNFLLYKDSGSCETSGYTTVYDESLCNILMNNFEEFGLDSDYYNQIKYRMDGCNAFGFVRDKIPKNSRDIRCGLCICANIPRTKCSVNVKSRSCEYHGYNSFTSALECSKATALPVTETSSSDIPYGCSVIDGVAYLGTRRGQECTNCFCDACGSLDFPYQILNGSCTDNLFQDIGVEEVCTEALEFFGMGTATIGTGAPGCGVDMGMVPGTGAPFFADVCEFYITSPYECLEDAKYLGFPEMGNVGIGAFSGVSTSFVGTFDECLEECNKQILLEIPIRTTDSYGYEYEIGVKNMAFCSDGTLATVSGWAADKNLRIWDDGTEIYTHLGSNMNSRAGMDFVYCSGTTVVYTASRYETIYVWKDGVELNRIEIGLSSYGFESMYFGGTNINVLFGNTVYVYDLSGTQLETIEVIDPICSGPYTCSSKTSEPECVNGLGLSEAEIEFVTTCCVWDSYDDICEDAQVSLQESVETSEGTIIVSINGQRPGNIAFIQADRTLSVSTGFSGEVESLALSPDETKVAAGGGTGDFKVIMWTATGERITESLYLSAAVVDVAFINNDKLAAVSNEQIYVYDSALQLLGTLNPGNVRSIASYNGFIWAGSTSGSSIGLRKLKLETCEGISRNGETCQIFSEITSTTEGDSDLYEKLKAVEVSEGPRCFYTDRLYYNPTPTTFDERQICKLFQRSTAPGINRICSLHKPSDFVLVESNTCEHFGYVTVKSSADCQEAASQLNLIHAADFSTNSYPEGCIRDVNENLRLNTQESVAQCDASAKCACYKRSVTMFYTQTQACPTPVETQGDCSRAVNKLFSKSIRVVSDPGLPLGCSGMGEFVWNTVGGACSDRTCVCAVQEPVTSSSRDIASQNIEKYDIPEVNKFVQTRIETPVRASKWLGYGSCAPTEDLPFHERTNPYVFDLSERECEAKCMNTEGCDAYSFTPYTHEGKGVFGGTYTEHDAESIEECAGMCNECAGFTYLGWHDQKKCYIFDELTALENPGSGETYENSYRMQNQCVLNFHGCNDRILLGDGICASVIEKSITLDECEEQCMRMDCTTFSYSGGTCKLGNDWCHTDGSSIFNTPAVCSDLPLGPNSNLGRRGCDSARWSGGEFSRSYCEVVGTSGESLSAALKEFYTTCCEWTGTTCVDKQPQSFTPSTSSKRYMLTSRAHKYYLSTKGDCQRLVSTQEECEAAGLALGLGAVTVEGSGGCVYDGTMKLVSSPACTSAECVCAPANAPGNRYAVSGARRPITTPWMGIPIYSSQKYTYSKLADQKCTDSEAVITYTYNNPGTDDESMAEACFDSCIAGSEDADPMYTWDNLESDTDVAGFVGITGFMVETPSPVTSYNPVQLETVAICNNPVSMNYVAQNTPAECAAYCGALGYTGFFINKDETGAMCKCATDGCSSRFGVSSASDMSTNQPARADSTIKSGTVAGNAVDGDTSQDDYNIMWHSADKGSDCSAFQAKSWWGVELKRALDYFNVKIYARNCCNGNGSDDIEVLVSNSFPTNGQDFTSFTGATASCGQLNGFGDSGIKNMNCRMDQEYRYVILRPKTCSGLSYHYFHIAEVEVKRLIPNADSYSIQSSTNVPGAVTTYTPFILQSNTFCNNQVTMDYVAENTPADCANYCGALGYTGFFMNNYYPDTMCKCSTDGCANRYSSYYDSNAYGIQVDIASETGKCYCTYAIPGGTCDGSSDFKHYVIQTDDASTDLPEPEPAKVGLRELETHEKYGFESSQRTCTTPVNPTTYPYDGLEDCLQTCLSTDLCQFVEINGNCKIMQDCSAFSYTGTLYEYDHFEHMKECPFPPCDDGVGWDDMYVKVPGKTVTSFSSSTGVAASSFEQCRNWCSANNCAAFVYGTSYCRAYGSVVETSDSEYDMYIKIVPTKYDYGYKLVSETDCISSSNFITVYNQISDVHEDKTEVCFRACVGGKKYDASPTEWDNFVVNGFRISSGKCECHSSVPESSSECTETGTTYHTYKITPYVFKDYKYEKVADSICIPGDTGTRVITYSGNIPGNTFEQKKDTCFQACLSGSEHVSTYKAWSWSTLNAATNGFYIKKDGTTCACISGVPETDSGCTDTEATYEMYRITPTPSGDTMHFEESVAILHVDYTVTTTPPNVGFVTFYPFQFMYSNIGVCRTVTDSPYYLGSDCPSLSAQECVKARIAFPEASGDCASVTPNSLVEFTGAVGTSEYIVDGYACTGSVTIKKYFSGHPLKIVEGTMTWQEAMDAPGVVSIPDIDTKTFTATAGTYTYICESHSQMIGRILVSECARVCKKEPDECGVNGDCVCLVPPNEDMCDGGAPLDTTLCAASGGTHENGICTSSGSKLCVRGEKLFDASRDCCGCGGGDKRGIAKTAYHYVKDGVSECVCSEDEQCIQENEDWDHYGFINMVLPYEFVGKGACTDMQVVKVEGNSIPERMGYCAAACSARNKDGFGMNATLCVCTNHCDNDYPLDRFGFKETFEDRYYRDEGVLVEAWDAQSRHLRCFKDLNKTEEVLCSHIRALHHFARGTSYRVGDCTHEAPGTENQIPCNGRGFVVSGTCYCDYAETLDIGSQGFGVTYEPPTLLQTPYRGKSCGHFCPGYNMRDMESVCSGHGVCQSTGSCDCDQSFAGYKCHVQCELEPGPLTCSGHGTCEEQDVPFEIDDTYEIADTIYSWKVCPEESGYLAQDKVLRIGDEVHYVFNEMSEMRYERYTVSIGSFFSLYSRGHRCDIPGYTLDRLVFANSPELFEQACEESCQAYKGFNTNYNDRKCECIMQVAPSECNTWTNSNGDIVGTLLEDEGWNLYEKREGDVLELQESREASMDDYYIYGPLYRMPYGSEEPHMPCYDSVLSTREKLTAPLIEISSNIVKLPCAVLPNYRVVCGACKCFEHDTLGHFTGYNCRTPAMGYYGVRGTKKCRGMNQDNEPCNGHGTCNWGSLLGLGQQVETQTQCFCGSVEDDVTFESAPRNNDGEIMIHVDNLGEPLYVRTLKYANVDCSTDGFQEVTTAESCREASAYMGSVWNNDLVYTFDGGCARIGSNMYLSTSEQFATEEVIDSCVEALPEATKTYTDVFSEGMLRITDPQECMVAVKALRVNQVYKLQRVQLDDYGPGCLEVDGVFMLNTGNGVSCGSRCFYKNNILNKRQRVIGESSGILTIEYDNYCKFDSDEFVSLDKGYYAEAEFEIFDTLDAAQENAGLSHFCGDSTVSKDVDTNEACFEFCLGMSGPGSSGVVPQDVTHYMFAGTTCTCSMSDLDDCQTKVQIGEHIFSMITSGSCESNGGVEPNQDECEEAALYFGYGDGGGSYGELAYAGGWTASARPRCFWWGGDNKIRYITTDDKVGDASETYKALCKVYASVFSMTTRIQVDAELACKSTTIDGSRSKIIDTNYVSTTYPTLESKIEACYNYCVAFNNPKPSGFAYFLFIIPFFTTTYYRHTCQCYSGDATNCNIDAGVLVPNSEDLHLYTLKNVRYYTSEQQYSDGTGIYINNKIYEPLGDNLIKSAFSDPTRVCVDTSAYGAENSVLNVHTYPLTDDIQECAAKCLNGQKTFVYFETLTYAPFTFFDEACNFGLGCAVNQKARVENRCWCSEYNDQDSCEGAGLSWLNPREDYSTQINSGLNPPGRGFRPLGVRGTTYIGPGYCDYNSLTGGGFQTYTGKTLGECAQLCYGETRCIVFAWMGNYPDYAATNKCVLADAHCDRGGSRVVNGEVGETYINSNGNVVTVTAFDMFKLYHRFKMSRSLYEPSGITAPSVTLTGSIAELPDRVKIKDVVCYANDVCPPE